MQYDIQIITLPEEGMKNQYLLNYLCDIWRNNGHNISVGSSDILEADLGIVHIDRTWVAENVLPINNHDRPLLNGKVLDISKRNISELILEENDEYEGPVIIKTNANYFGLMDHSKNKLSTFFRRHHQTLARRTSWQIARQLIHREYPILDEKTQVPNWVWKREALIVEKFIPEIEDGLYVLRLWLFFGDREYGVKMWSRSPLVKSDGIERYEYINDFPDELRKIRKDLGFDFGKFDYVIVDGKPILIDANKTPALSSSSISPSPKLLNLAEGIHSFMREYKGDSS
jgi:hypothetical protein